MTSFKLVLLGALLLPTLAFADKTPDELYKDGQDQYNLQNFDKAIEAFKKGYELEPDEGKKSAYLFNVAQSYRQRGGPGDCGKAQFYYKRYLSLKDQDTAKPLAAEKRKQVEDRIGDLEECVQRELKNKPPTDNVNPNEGDPKPDPNAKKKVVGTKPEGGGDEDEDGGGVHKKAIVGPKLLTARVIGGGNKISAGGIDVPIQATFGLVAGYPMALNPKLGLDFGAALNITPVPYQKGSSSATGSLTMVLANAGGTYEIMPKLSARVDVGVGALFFGNVSGSPFTMDRPTTGTLGMFAARGAASVDYEVIPNLVVTATPASFSYSPAKAGLRDDIKQITMFEFMVGVGYRM